MIKCWITLEVAVDVPNEKSLKEFFESNSIIDALQEETIIINGIYDVEYIKDRKLKSVFYEEGVGAG